MFRANTEHTPTRRKFLGQIAGGAAVVAVAASAASLAQAVQPENADAELIVLCAQFDDLQRRTNAVFETADDDDEQDALIAPLHGAQNDLAERICSMRATTSAGFSALAATIALAAPEMVDEEHVCDAPGGLLAMLLRDLTANSVDGGAA
jgi:hypothetical protein